MRPEIAKYVEELALYFENSGLPRIAGRIFGLLLVCEPPYLSAGQIAEELGVSRGSVSTMTRLLENTGFVEKVAIPGQRSAHYAITDDAFERRFEMSARGLTMFRELADRGLEVLSDESDERKSRLREMRELTRFWELEMPKIQERWRQKKAAESQNEGES